MNSCSFFGHRDIVITNKLKADLKSRLVNLIEKENYINFYFGEFGDFDNLAYEIITELKVIFPNIVTIYVATDEKSLKRHRIISAKEYDKQIVFALDFDWWYQRIYFRNIEIIKNSNFVFFYVNNTKGSGAYKALQYAKKIKVKYLNIASIT